MDRNALQALLEQVASGDAAVDDALARLTDLPFADIDGARVDTHRVLRLGLPEVVYGEGKTPDQIARIVLRQRAAGQSVLVTRAAAAAAEAVLAVVPDADWHPLARCLVAHPEGHQDAEGSGHILVICAGTSDLPVAREALITAQVFGNRAELLADVGVAGLHRILAERGRLHEAKVIIVVAGMEGALPSVVGGLTARPTIAVPTSVGYGAAFGGLAALLGMLNSCAAGVTVVNIDNGFGAAWAATLINRADELP